MSAIEAVFDKIKKRINRRDAVLFLAFFFIALVVHLYALTHKFINHDDFNEIFGGSFSALESGRWTLAGAVMLFGRTSSPGALGTIGSGLLAAGAFLTVKLFDVRHPAAALAVGLCFVAYPAVVCTYAYMFTAPAYFLAICLVLAGLLIIRRGGWRLTAAGSVLIALGMGTYQAYIGFATGFAVALLALDICSDRWDGEWKPLLLECLRTLAGLVLAVAVYFIGLKLCLLVTGAELTGYAGIDSMGSMTASTLIQRVGTAYRRFFKLPEWTVFTSVHRAFRYLMCLAVCVLPAWAVWAAVRRRLWRSPVTLLLLLALLAVEPLAVNIVYVMAETWAVHDLMTYQNVLVWLLPAVLADRISLPDGEVRRRLAAALAVLLLAVSAASGYEGLLMTGREYLIMEETRDSVTAYLTRLTARIEMTEGYEQGMKVIICGDGHMSGRLPDDGLTGILPGNKIINMYSRYWLIVYTQGFDYEWVPPEEESAVTSTEEFRSMPVYPEPGSIRLIDGVMAVKLGEEQ